MLHTTILNLLNQTHIKDLKTRRSFIKVFFWTIQMNTLSILLLFCMISQVMAQQWYYEPRRMPIVACIDSGIDPNLGDQIPGLEVVAGWDFVDNDNTPYSTGNSHGTKTAGILGQMTDGVKVMPLRVLNNNGISTEQQLIDAVNFAKDNGADFIQGIILISSAWGLPAWNQPNQFQRLRDAIANSGLLFIGVPGNEGLNLNTTVRYPPEFINQEVNNMIMVSGSDQTDNIFTSYGTQTVDMAAPGEDIEFITGGIGSGASYAAPQVAALAVRLLQLDPSLNNNVQNFKNALLSYTDNLGLNVITGGRLNAFHPPQVTAPAPPPLPPAPSGRNAWQFDKTLDQRVEYNTIIDGWSEATIAVWVRLESSSGTQDIVSQWNFPQAERTFLIARVQSSGTWHFEVGNVYVQGLAPVVGQNQLLVARFGKGEISLTVDGEKFSTSAIGPMASELTPLIVGDQEDAGKNNLEGVIAGLAIWDVKLTDAEADTLLMDRDNLQTVSPGNRQFLDMYESAPLGTIVNGPLTQANY